MFKNAIVYRIKAGFDFDLTAAETGLAKHPFAPCSPTQAHSSGWTPARKIEHGALVEPIGGQWIARFFTETKAVPGAVLARAVDTKAAAIEQSTGRKPGRKERKELKEEALMDLLPHAFPKQSACWVWIDQAAGLLVIDTASQSKADDVVSALVEALPGLSLALLNTQTSPAAAMAHWLATQEAPPGFTIDRECELKSADESKAVVKYGRHPLDIAEVQDHIRAGKQPTKLAMTWDGRVSFLLTEGLQVKKLAFLDAAMDAQSSDDGGFDADVAIATGELRKLIPDLIEALGGEIGAEGAAA